MFGNGATGAVLDGSVHASGNRSMLFHTYTAVHSDGLGIFLKANANAEMISTFTYYCQVGFAAIGGSKIRSLNSSKLSYGGPLSLKRSSSYNLKRSEVKPSRVYGEALESSGRLSPSSKKPYLSCHCLFTRYNKLISIKFESFSVR